MEPRVTYPSASLHSGSSTGISDAKLISTDVSVVAEERRKERIRALSRNLEVCDLLDMRNVQSVAEHAPKIT